MSWILLMGQSTDAESNSDHDTEEWFLISPSIGSISAKITLIEGICTKIGGKAQWNGAGIQRYYVRWARIKLYQAHLCSPRSGWRKRKPLWKRLRKTCRTFSGTARSTAMLSRLPASTDSAQFATGTIKCRELRLMTKIVLYFWARMEIHPVFDLFAWMNGDLRIFFKTSGLGSARGPDPAG